MERASRSERLREAHVEERESKNGADPVVFERKKVSLLVSCPIIKRFRTIS